MMEEHSITISTGIPHGLLLETPHLPDYRFSGYRLGGIRRDAECHSV